MAVDVSHILADLLGRNSGPDPLNPDGRLPANYGVAASLDGNLLSLTLAFRCGVAYCCPEASCHLPLSDARRWVKLREAFASCQFALPARLELRLSCVIEEGALFFDFHRPDPHRRGWYAMKPAEASRYELTTVEALHDAEAETEIVFDH